MFPSLTLSKLIFQVPLQPQPHLPQHGGRPGRPSRRPQVPLLRAGGGGRGVPLLQADCEQRAGSAGGADPPVSRGDGECWEAPRGPPSPCQASPALPGEPRLLPGPESRLLGLY